MKIISSLIAVILSFAFAFSTISASHADEPYYWPEFGTLSSHNEWALKAIGGDLAHELGATGAGIKVAVLDSGVALSAPGLANKIVAYKDFLPSQPPLPEHGTMTASTVAADYDATTGVGGVAPGASLVIGRVCYLDWCDQEAAKKAIIWAVNQGARVISMSFTAYDDPEMNAILVDVTRRGVVVVAALGNFGCRTYEYWGLNTSCTQGKTNESSNASYAISGLIGAGASDHFGGRAFFSSWGPNLDLLAPGVENIAYDPVGATNGFGGTSAATPLIAGVAALVLEANPNLSAGQVQAILQSTTRKALEVKPKVWDSCEKSGTTNQWSCNKEVDSNLPQQFFTGAGIVAADKAVLLARKMVDGKTLPAPTIEAADKTAQVSWTGGPADLYINSKLAASSVTSPFELTGESHQSFSVQLVRGKDVSEPAITVLRSNTIPKPAVIADYNHNFEIVGRADSLFIQTNDIPKDDPTIPWGKNWLKQIGGVFEFSDGTTAPCVGYDGGPPQIEIRSYSFTCRLEKTAGNYSGHFRLISADSILGEPSGEFSVRLYPAWPTIEVRTKYLAEDKVRFDWDEFAGAQSYEYRYLTDGSYACTTDTFVEVSSGLSQPSNFSVSAKEGDACSGNSLALSPYYPFRLLKPAPAKPTNISIKDASPTYVEFQATLANPSNTWRIYRSDGLFMRYNSPGQRLVVGMQPNEDVNGRSFTYRFMEVAHDTWGDSWSPLSDPITVSFAPLAAPRGNCFRSIELSRATCDVIPNSNSDGTLIEFLDSDGHVVASRDTKRWTSQRFSFSKVKGAYSVRLTSTSGNIPNWYRRGDSVVIPLHSLANSNRYRYMLAQ